MKIQGLFRAEAAQKELDEIFGGKPVTWEGKAVGLWGDGTVQIRMPECQVNVTDDQVARASVLTLAFDKKEDAWIQGSLTIPSMVLFSATLVTPPKATEPYAHLLAMVKTPVHYLVVEREGKEPLHRIDINTEKNARLLGYVDR